MILDPFEPYIKAVKFIILVGLFPAGFIAGCVDEKGRFDAWKDLQAVVGKAQEERTAERIKSDKRLKEKTDAAWKSRMARLQRDHDAFTSELLASAGSGVLPTTSPTTGLSGGTEGDSGVVCFAGERLSEGINGELAGFAARYARSIKEGATAIAGFKACAEWALEAHPK